MKLLTRVSAAVALLTITGSAYAVCNLVDTNAQSVQWNSGHGNFTCDSLSTEGSTVRNLWAEGIAIVEPGSADKTAKWMIKPSLLDTDGDGLQDHTYRIFITSTTNGGGGSTCNYLYDGQTVSGDKLGDADGGQIKLLDTLVCGDPVAVEVPEEEPAEPDIVTTFGDACVVSVTYDDGAGGTTTISPGITDFFTYGLDPVTGGDLEQYGVCAGDGLGGQFECIGEEQTIPVAVPADCPSLTPTDGTIEGRCAPIDTSQRIANADGTALLQPCWNYVNRWCDDAAGPNPECANRVDFPSFDPRTLVRETSSSTQVWQGSPYCYLSEKIVRGKVKQYWVCIEI